MKRSQKLAILTALAMGVNFSNHASASDTDYVYYNGQKFVELEFYNEGEFSSQYTLLDKLKTGTKSATSYWSGIFAPRSQFSSPWQIMVVTEKNMQNATAVTMSYKDKEDVYDNYPAWMIQNGKKLNPYDMKKLAGIKIAPEDADERNGLEAIKIVENTPGGDTAVSLVTVGQHFGANCKDAIDGWWVDTDTILPTNEQAVDFVGTFRHELAHALGISISMSRCDWDGKDLGGNDPKITYGEDALPLIKFSGDIIDKNNWLRHLVDKNGTHAKSGMMAVTTEGFNLIKEKHPEAVPTDYYILDKDDFAYFVGEHVTDALAGATFNGVSGLPVNGWEGDGMEGAHFQTAGMMSHRPYSNYMTFMEAELAAMQDLGYDFDRKAYFGYSVYGNGQTINNTHGYAARNAAGTDYTSDYSQISLGIGLHVYGANNTITQAANILTQGTGAAGIRVDGEKNTINVPNMTEIHADGYRGKGILFAYGRNQNLNLAGSVTANGNGGNAVEFNFGSSSNGALDEYRGSYIRYERLVDEETGEISKGANKILNDMDRNTYNASADELNGEMIANFNLSGKIAGGGHAIYIGRNAFVQNINVEGGAEIKGNITSEWKHFSKEYGFWDTEQETTYKEEDEDGKIVVKPGKIEPLYIQYEGGRYVYNQYTPDLVTNLNVNGDINYSGNISGTDNMRLNVTAGTMTFGGTADVISVNVAQDAVLYGGNFTVNDMSDRFAAGYENDNTTGKFINHGAIGAASNDTVMTIKGDLVSDGMLCAYGGGDKGYIEVAGNAQVDGSTIMAFDMVPGETVTALKADTITGEITNPENAPYKASDLMNLTGKKTDTNITVTAQAREDGLTVLDAGQKETFAAMNDMSKALAEASDNRRDQLRPLYQMDAGTAGRALQEIGRSEAPQMISLAQQSTLASRVISDRLSTAFSMRPVAVTVPANHLSDSDKTDDGLKLNVELPVAQDNNAWVKFTKNWGDLKGGASYHGSAISGGYDHRIDDHWRGGVFLSYQAMGLGAESSSANIYDTRFGVYAGYHKDAADAYIYADYGWVRNKLRRSIGMLGMGAEAKYNAHVMEIGGEYKYDLHASDGKTWHVSPYLGMQLSWLNQGGYTENGAGVFNQQVAGLHNTYVAGQLGLELKRYLQRGNYGLRLGVKHAFSGADPELSFHYEGWGGQSYTLRNSQDKTHFLCSLSGELEFSKGWFLGGEAQFLKGAHDKDVSASVQFKRVW